VIPLAWPPRALVAFTLLSTAVKTDLLLVTI
jgi:hypothetical protein